MIAVAIAAGCTNDNVDMQIQQPPQSNSEVGKDGLTPLERGKVRRQILNDMRENMDIWLKGDTQNYDKAFSKKLIKIYREQLDKLHQRGQDKVRVHENTRMEVVELDSPTVGAVKYYFDEKSYFIDIKTKKITKFVEKAPQGQQSQFEIVVIKEDGRWKIDAMIGAGEATL